MKGDFTRDTFDPSKHYSRVLQQQGRVQLDADWNEQTAIVLHYLRTLARDLIGPHGGPVRGNGFVIITDVKNVTDADGLELTDAERLKVLEAAIEKGDFVIGAGRYYVEGILVENDAPITYSEQAGYPFDDKTARDDLKAWKKDLAFYLDVWERHITYVEDDHIREVALGGPDTATRAQIVWQVKVLLQANETGLTCDSINTVLLPTGTGRLRARARLDQPQTELCVIPPASRYRGAENQLYRVEIHRGGKIDDASGGPTFKWSRENGSVIFPVISVGAAASGETTVLLASLGRDDRLGLQVGDWVEVVDDQYVLQNRSDALLQVTKIEELTVTLAGLTNVASGGKNKLLRRWDQQGDVKLDGALQVVEHDDTDAGLREDWTTLEDGVQIWFAKGGEYHTGDYWLIPARVATGDVDWPQDLDANKNPVGAAMLAHGPRHYYAPLAVRHPSTATNAGMKPCRCTIGQITNCPP